MVDKRILEETKLFHSTRIFCRGGDKVVRITFYIGNTINGCLDVNVPTVIILVEFLVPQNVRNQIVSKK